MFNPRAANGTDDLGEWFDLRRIRSLDCRPSFAGGINVRGSEVPRYHGDRMS